MYGPGHSIRLRSSARTSKGRVRQNNEDNVHLWGNDGYVLAVVADGMGGAVAGEEASRIAVETVHEEMVNEIYRKPDDYGHLDSYDLAEKLESAVKQANVNILKKAIARPELKGMGTTITMAFARQSDVVLAHVGDSRAYFIDGQDGSISQMTADHSFVQALVDAGRITQEEAEDHPMKNVLYRALGQSPDVDIDVISDGHLHIGDRLVLCSDGLTLHVKTHEIATAAMRDSDPNIISQRLIELANSRGGKDNISVIVIVVEGESSTMTTASAIEMDAPYSDDDPTLPLPRNNNNNNRTPRQSSPPNPNSSSGTLNMISAAGEGRDGNEPLQ